MGHRQRKHLAAIRRRVEDDGDEEGGPDVDLDDDSFSEDSLISDDEDINEGDEIRALQDASMDSAEILRVNGNSPRQEKAISPDGGSEEAKKSMTNGTGDMDVMLSDLKLLNRNGVSKAVHYADLRDDEEIQQSSPAIVKLNAKMGQLQEAPQERRRREHEEYRKKRDEDPAFVPNRGAFFMHDHRHSGPAANGFRPFGRGRGRGRPGIGGPSTPANQTPLSHEASVGPWTHDMHEVISEPPPRNILSGDCMHGNSGIPPRIPVSSSKAAPPNRALSVTKLLGNVQIRVFLSAMQKPISFPGVPIKQYTRLPDHRPPLRRDKPVRISIPDHPPRYIFPAVDRSFIFIPRAMRPNQQGFGGRGRGKSVLGSIGGYSRRTSVFGGSVYGSAHTPSVALSRRSSLAREVNRESLVSPAGSTMSRPQMAIDRSKPVVRLPPSGYDGQQQCVQKMENCYQNGPPPPSAPIDDASKSQVHAHTLVQRPAFRENQSNQIPMHQPRPQKTVSVADIESPAKLQFNPPQQYQQPFHQQVPIQVNSNNYSHEAMLHSRNTSYPSQTSTGTPLSQIPERAIHAQPFQPNPYPQPQHQHQQFYSQPYQVVHPPQGYYYPPNYNSVLPTPGSAPPLAPAPQQALPLPASFPQSNQPDGNTTHTGVQGLVAQEVNGMVYYYDAAQIPAVATFPAYQAPSYPMHQVGGIVGMGGMMTPSPDGFYYPQAPPGVVYYSQ